MQWFVTEQVEEEKSARDIIAKLEMAGSDARALLEIDRELGARAGAGGRSVGAARRGTRPGLTAGSDSPAAAVLMPCPVTRTPAPWAGATSAAAPCR